LFLFEIEPWDDARSAVHAVLEEAGYELSSLKRGSDVPGVRGRMVLARPKES
jgi:hypothetical protein